MWPASTTYGVREVAQLLGVPTSRVRSMARAGLLEPERGPRGELRFGFRDLAFLRRLRDLPDDGVTPRRVRRALVRLRALLPPERDLRELGLATSAGELVVREHDRLWSPESGQFVFDFDSDRGAPGARVARLVVPDAEPERDADGWYRLGSELEGSDPGRAHAAYQRALACEPGHPDAHVNLGCLDHEAGRLGEAEAHYRAALASRPEDTTARFNLGVVLEDGGRDAEARASYLDCLAADPTCAEAHYNLARVCERLGENDAVMRHLLAFRRLVRE